MNQNFKQITSGHTFDIVSNIGSISCRLSSSLNCNKPYKNIRVLPSFIVNNKVDGTPFSSNNNDNDDNLFFIYLIGYNYYWYYTVSRFDVLKLNIENRMKIILKEFSEIYKILEKTSNKF